VPPVRETIAIPVLGPPPLRLGLHLRPWRCRRRPGGHCGRPEAVRSPIRAGQDYNDRVEICTLTRPLSRARRTLKKPMDAIAVRKMPVGPERHVTHVVQ
jgi:hypothetical protein